MHKLTLALSALCCQAAAVVSAQEYGPIRIYPGPGQFYSILLGDPITRESYVVSERTYRREDSYGKEGTLRHVFSYSGGQRDTLMMKFFVRCKSVSSTSREVKIWGNEQHQEQARLTIISADNQAPSEVERDAYDLHRFLCDDRQGAPMPSAAKKGTTREESMDGLVACCLAYCRAVGCNSPPAETGCSRSFLASTIKKYPSAYPTLAAYKRNLYTSAKSYNGAVVRACL